MKEKDEDVTFFPRCNVVFNQYVAKAFEVERRKKVRVAKSKKMA